jgi:heat-inducible transcriptional repressor
MAPRRRPPIARGAPRRLEDLTPRQQSVLELLVRQFLSTARPVASQALAVEGGFAWAPATVRQAMNELEELGLLEQPHAASGRVPTDRGYRLLVDGLIAPGPLAEDEREAIEGVLASSARDVEELLAQASRLLADLSTQVGFAVAPNPDDAVLTGLELVHLGERRVLLVLSVRGGAVRTMQLELVSPLGRGELERVARLLDARLLGRTLAEVRRRLAHDEALVRDGAAALVADAVVAALTTARPPGVYAFGTARVARLPEFREATSLRPLLALFEHQEPWRELVSGDDGAAGLSVTIGREHGRAEWAHLSLVRFRIAGAGDASIGLLGPRRMDYGRAMGLVDFVGRRLSSLLPS